MGRPGSFCQFWLRSLGLHFWELLGWADLAIGGAGRKFLSIFAPKFVPVAFLLSCQGTQKILGPAQTKAGHRAIPGRPSKAGNARFVEVKWPTPPLCAKMRFVEVKRAILHFRAFGLDETPNSRHRNVGIWGGLPN